MALIHRNNHEILLRNCSKDANISFIMFDKSKKDKSVSQNEALHHLQRAIEKCLKALLVIEDVNYKNSHDIRYLLICVTHQLPPIESIVKIC